jgi:hypothetical protein
MKKKDECQELKNIEYKTMLIGSKKNIIIKNNDDIEKVKKFLETEKKSNNNKKVSWSNLTKTEKLNKINEYSIKYSNDNKLTKKQQEDLNITLVNYFNHKKFQKVKDVKYNKNTGIIDSIPNLYYNKVSKKFSLKRNEKKSTSNSLGPGRTRKKKHNKEKVLNKD